MLKCLIIDDEPLAIDLIESYIAKVDDMQVLGTFTDPIKAIQQINELNPDLVFLDIQMPELTGMQFIKVTNHKFPIIFTTAYQEYALEGYTHDVIDYLLKPISFDRFLVAVSKAKERLEPSQKMVPDHSNSTDYIFIKTSYKTIRLDFDQIKYFEGLGDYVAVHTPDGKHLTLEKLKDFDKSLPKDKFMRVHKSFILNLSAIEYIERNRAVIGEKRIPIGGSYQKDFWDKVQR